MHVRLETGGVFSPLWELEELVKPQEGLPTEAGKIPNTPRSTNTGMAHAGPTGQKAGEWRR